MKKARLFSLLVLFSLSTTAPLLAQESVPHTPVGSPLQSGASIELERTSQVGGPIGAVAVAGDYAYVGIGWQLAVFDVSGPAYPVMVGQTYAGGGAEGIAAADGYAYLVYGGSYLDVFDVSDPAAPRKVGTCTLPGSAHAHEVAVAGETAYVAYGSGGLRVIDVSTPAAPVEVGSLGMEAIGIDVNGTYAYVASWYGGLRVVDVSNPAAPKQVGVVDTPGQAHEVSYVPSGYALVADGTGGLRFIDVSNPEEPAQDGFYNPGLGINTNTVFALGNYAYFSNSSGGMRLEVLEISGLPGYTFQGAEAIPGEILDINGKSGYAYVAADEGGLRAVLTTPNVVEVSAYEAPSWTLGVAVDGDRAYVADGENGLYVVDISDPTAPVKRGVVETPDDAEAVDAAGSYAYVAANDAGLRVINVSNPAAPVEVGHVDTPGRAKGVDVVGSYAYVADQLQGLRVVDVSNPAAPHEVGHLNTPGTATNVFVKAGRAYVADGDKDLRIVDVSTPGAPVEIGNFEELGSIEDAVVAGNLAYLAGDSYGLRIVNVSDPANPQQMGSLDKFRAADVFVAGEYAFVTDEVYGLYMVDVLDPTTPVQFAHRFTDLAYDVEVVGGYAYVAAHRGGLIILRLPPVDLSIDWVGPVQSLEGQDLVKDKATAVKAVIHKTGSGLARNVAVRATANGSTFDSFYVADYANVYTPTYALVADRTGYPLDFASGEYTQTVYFFGAGLAPTGSTMQVTVEVDAQGAVAETDEENNEAQSGAVAVYDTEWPRGGWYPDLYIYYFPLDWAHQVMQRPTSEYLDFYEASNAFLSGVYPVAEERFKPQRASIYSASTTTLRGQDGTISDFWLVSFAIRLYPELKLAHPTADRFVAVVPQDWFSVYTSGAKTKNTRGIAIPNMPLVIAEALVPDEPNGPAPVLHEIGHTWGLRTKPDSQEEYDDPNVDVLFYGNYSDDGLWVDERIPILVDPTVPPDSVERAVWCFMGRYQATAEWWIDAEDYTKLLTSTRVTTAAARAREGAASTKAILAAGTLEAGGEVRLDNWYVLPEAEVTSPEPGPYAFEYQAADGTILHSVSFDLSYQAGYLTLDDAPFAYTIPYVPETAKIVITRDGSPVSQKEVSAHAPAISMVAPNGGETLVGQATIRWTGEDADGDALTYILLASRDGGTTWDPVAGDLTGAEYRWDLSNVPPGSQYKAKVVATDGFHTGEDVSDEAFEIRVGVFLPLVVRE